MSLVNICRDNHDPFYRYKMPLLQIKKEGRGNGVKTNVLNAEEVARALARPVSYVIKYFGFELGAQTAIDVKNEKFIINGHHEQNHLQDVLDGFIQKFVLCPECNNPETVLEVTKTEDLQRDCKACGKITTVDPRLKLVTFILKNPPPKEKKKKSATASANVVGGGKTISDIAAKSKSGANEDEGDEDEDAKLAKSTPVVEVADDDWAVDMSEEAVKARALELQIAESNKEKYVEFGKWILLQEEIDDIEIYKKAVELNIATDRETIEVLAQVLFTEDIIDEIEDFKAILAKLITTEKHEKSLLGGIERMIATQNMELVSLVPKILMKLYDDDLVSEDVIRDWAGHVSAKYTDKTTSRTIRKNARSFIKWLNEAEDEDDDEEDDE